MKTILNFFVIFTLITIQGCGEERDKVAMEKNFPSLQECLFAMKQVSHGPLDIVIDTPEMVSGYFANKENFSCQRKITGTQGISYDGYYFVDTKTAVAEAPTNYETVESPAISEAHYICEGLKHMGSVNKCEVNSSGLTIDAIIDDTNSTDAQVICNGVGIEVAKHTRPFGGKWKLRFFSPYSSETPIATCNLA